MSAQEFSQYPTHEPLPEVNQSLLLGHVANSETKLIASAIINLAADKPFTTKDLWDELDQQQAPWLPKQDQLFNYCQYCLTPAGMVTAEAARHQRTYQGTDLGTTWGLSFAGILLDWSLQHPDISLNRVFGKSTSHQAMRLPELRYRIYRALAANVDGDMSYSDLKESIANDRVSPRKVGQVCRDMAELGNVAVRSPHSPTNPAVEIVNPDSSGRLAGTESFAKLKPETQAVFTAIGTLLREGSIETDLDTLVARSAAITDGLDRHYIRRILRTSLAKGSTRSFGLKRLDKDTLRPQNSVVSLDDEMATPLRDLITEVEALFRGEGVEGARAKIVRIGGSREAIAELIGKEQRLSRYRDVKTEGREMLNERLLSIIRSMGEATLTDLQTELKTQGKNMTTAGIRIALGPLVHNDTLQHALKARSPTDKRVLSYYSLNEKLDE